MNKQKISSKTNGFTILELLVALTLGVIVIAMTMQAAGNMSVGSKRSQANIAIQQTKTYVDKFVGNALKSIGSSPCSSLSSMGNIGSFKLPVPITVGGNMFIDNTDYDFTSGKRGFFTLYVNNSTNPNPFPLPNIPALPGIIANMLPNTDYFIYMQADNEKDTVLKNDGSIANAQYTISQTTSVAPPANSIYLMSDCATTTALFQLNAVGVTATFNGSPAWNIIVPGSNPTSSNGAYIKHIDYQILYVGRDVNGSPALMSQNLTVANSQPQTLVKNVSNMQITWSVSQFSVANNFYYRQFVKTSQFAAPVAPVNGSINDQMENIVSASFVFTVAPDTNSGVLGAAANTTKQFTSVYTLRNKITQ